MLPILFMALFLGSWIAIWGIHVYLIRFKLDRYMTDRFKDTWENMKGDIEMFERNMWGPYYSREVYNFLWKSSDDFGDEYIQALKGRIRQLKFELIIYFCVLFFTIAGIVLYKSCW